MARIRINNDLELTALQERDAAEIFALVDQNRKYLGAWMPWIENTRSAQDTLNFIRRVNDQMKRQEEFHFAVRFLGHIAGVLGTHKVDWDKKAVPLGYWLAPEYQGLGIMNKACTALINEFFSKLKLRQIEIYCALHNEKSRRVAERLGFSEIKKVTNAECINGQYIDHAVYSLQKNQWRNHEGQ